MKPPDSMGAHGCASCHSVVDGRSPLPDSYSRTEVMLAFAEAVMRTQQAMREAA
jgi:hypothetical protein